MNDDLVWVYHKSTGEKVAEPVLRSLLPFNPDLAEWPSKKAEQAKADGHEPEASKQTPTTTNESPATGAESGPAPRKKEAGR